MFSNFFSNRKPKKFRKHYSSSYKKKQDLFVKLVDEDIFVGIRICWLVGSEQACYDIFNRWKWIEKDIFIRLTTRQKIERKCQHQNCDKKISSKDFFISSQLNKRTVLLQRVFLCEKSLVSLLQNVANFLFARANAIKEICQKTTLILNSRQFYIFYFACIWWMTNFIV